MNLVRNISHLCLRMMLVGVLLFRTPTFLFAQEADHSQEGQIRRPAIYESQNTEDNIFQDDPLNNAYGYYTIMGNTTASVEEMVSLYNQQNVEYPSAALAPGGAGSIELFCEILIEEAELEDVRAEVVFAQSMLETGWLQFRGDSKAEQYNFAGLGTTGGGVAGIYFEDVRTGLRAQVQHLKAYASSEELNQECIDERFSLVNRESAPYVEWLGQQENPYGGGWAAGADYGYKLRTILANLKDEEYEWPE